MKKLISVLLTLSIICGMLSFSALAVYSPTEIDSSLYYAKAELSKFENGDTYINAYNKLEDAVKNHQSEIEFSQTEYPITTDELHSVFDAFVNDHPQYFHLDRYNYSTAYNPDTNVVVKLVLQYLISDGAYDVAHAKFDSAAEKILEKIPENLSEYETELAIHDALIKHIDYTPDVPDEHDAYGALVFGKAVCDGYAKAFQYLLYKRGIQSTVVEGEVALEDGTFGGHAWNLVRIDGKYYYTDVTHDDPVASGKPKLQIYHNYFNLTETMMFRDRYAFETIYPLPECNSVDAFYFEQAGNKINDAYSVDEVAAKIIEGGGVAHIYVNDDTDYAQWFFDNAMDIYSKWGISTATQFSYSGVDAEHILMIVCPNDVNTDGTVDSVDALTLKQGLLGIADMTEANVMNGESNANGVIDAVDYANLKLAILQ